MSRCMPFFFPAYWESFLENLENIIWEKMIHNPDTFSENLGVLSYIISQFPRRESHSHYFPEKSSGNFAFGIYTMGLFCKMWPLPTVFMQICAYWSNFKMAWEVGVSSHSCKCSLKGTQNRLWFPCRYHRGHVGTWAPAEPVKEPQSGGSLSRNGPPVGFVSHLFVWLSTLLSCNLTFWYHLV